MSVDEGGDQL